MQYDPSIVDRTINIAEQAGRILMRHFNQRVTVDYKQDNSPVTQADIESSRFIEEQLAALTPNIPVISEERETSLVNAQTYWLVDPLDGTRAFVKGVPEFTVNIGLVHHQQAILGILHVPAANVSYAGGVDVPAFKIGGDGKRQPIHTKKPSDGNWTVVRSSSHASDQLQTYLEQFPVGHVIGMSSALKFGIMAEGGADLYPRLGKTMEWDTAAGQAIVEAAGGVMQTLDGEPFFYGKAGYFNPGFVVFANAP